MAINLAKSLEIIETMENYLTGARPPVEIRHEVDVGYEIDGHSVILFEIRPVWRNPSQYENIPYAKTTFVKKSNVWKVFWKRADLKWHSYKPRPTVRHLKDFLNLVDEDQYGCFRG